jgi:hypothetical protein
MQKKHLIILLAVGLPLMGFMGCTGLLVVAGVVAAANQDGTEGSPQNLRGQLPMNQMGQGQLPQGNGGWQNTTGWQGNGGGWQGGGVPMNGQMPINGGGGGFVPGGDGGSSLPSYDPMKNTPGVNGFNQYINDQSSIQDNQTGQITHNLDNSVANPIVESGQATVVSPDTSSASSSGSE